MRNPGRKTRRCDACGKERALVQFPMSAGGGHSYVCFDCGKPEPRVCIPPDERKRVYPVVDGKKRCGHCEQYKPLEEFYRKTSGPQGRSCWCRTCLRQAVLKSKPYLAALEAEKAEALRAPVVYEPPKPIEIRDLEDTPLGKW